jgi:tetratricopeptide (TPR) repeat protein
MRFQTAALALFPAIFLSMAQAEVRVWESTLTLPTYEEGSPDPNPPFDLFATTRFNYPYTLRETLTNRRVDHSWRAVYLENEYLKCSVLPDIGGHIYTCTDKVSGQPMFYANPSIKKAQIGYRGAWAAFGVEFNFPVSHNWVSMSPVNFAYSKHDDGSASVTVGNIDRVYGMEWTVEIVLRPGSTVVEEHVILSNRSDVRHRFYWWNNGAVQVWDDSQIQYPMRFAASHGFTEVQPWPVDPGGTDLSLIRNQTKGPVSLFVHGSREPFMAIWNPHTNTGTLHFAEYAQLPAKKIWSWGVDPDGLDWRRALSDNNSAYAEVQAGLFRNQETYAFLEPRQNIRFSEYWVPVRDTGGTSRANLSGVLHLSRADNVLHAAFNANQQIQRASIRIADGKTAVAQETVDLSPERTWKRDVAIGNADHRFTFELKDASGAVLLRHTEGEYDWTPADQIHVGPQPSHELPPPEKRTEDDWVQLGKNDELDGAILTAFATYQQGSVMFPKSFALNKAAGRLAACLLRYEDAVRYLDPVQQRDTSDPETSYYLGIAYGELGDQRKAQGAFEAAHRMPQFRSAGALRLAELLAREGRMQAAEGYLNESLRAEPDDLRTAEELVAVRRALGDEPAARTLAAEWLSRYPISDFLREELGNPDLPSLGADPYRVLNVAAEYIRLGLYHPALAVLSRKYPASPPDQSEPGSVLPQDHPLIAYYRAYCENKLGMPSMDDYAAASKLSTLYVFPNSAETVHVLQAALHARPSDGTAHYLLGTFFFSRGLTDAALQAWEEARKLTPHIPVLNADIGIALLHIRKDLEGALSAFEDGVAVDAKNPALYVGMDEALSLMKRPAKDRVQALERYPDLAQMPSNLVYELALNRAEAGDFEGAKGLFHNRFFPRQEGGTNVRQVWVEVLLQEALSLQRTGHCEAAIRETHALGAEVPGLPFTRDGLTPMLHSGRTQYFLGVLASACGQTEEARKHFERASKEIREDQITWAYAAARRLGESSAGEWTQQLAAALTQAERNSKTVGDNSVSMYTAGCIEATLGHQQQADEAFQEALLLPDQMMAYHLSRLARAGSIPD